MFEKINYEDFCKIVDTDFSLDLGGQTIAFSLIEISEKQETSRTVCFSILLKGPKDIFFQQDTYKFKHETFGECELFIVPVREDVDGLIYESIFNRYAES